MHFVNHIALKLSWRSSRSSLQNVFINVLPTINVRNCNYIGSSQDVTHSRRSIYTSDFLRYAGQHRQILANMGSATALALLVVTATLTTQVSRNCVLAEFSSIFYKLPNRNLCKQIGTLVRLICKFLMFKNALKMKSYIIKILRLFC